MARRKKTEIVDSMTLIEESGEEMPLEEEIKETGLLTEPPKKAEERQDPPVTLDASEQEAYLEKHGLIAEYEKRNGSYICCLYDENNKAVIGYDAMTKQPQAFGLTKERALFNAVTRHEALPKPQKPKPEIHIGSILSKSSITMSGYVHPLDEMPLNTFPPMQFAAGSVLSNISKVENNLLKALEAYIKEQVKEQVKDEDNSLRSKLAALLEEES